MVHIDLERKGDKPIIPGGIGSGKSLPSRENMLLSHQSKSEERAPWLTV
jgi:hypothetical protein